MNKEVRSFNKQYKSIDGDKQLDINKVCHLSPDGWDQIKQNYNKTTYRNSQERENSFNIFIEINNIFIYLK